MKQSDTELIPDKFTLEVQRMDGGSWAVTSPEIQGMILAHNELSKVFLPLETVATRLIRHNELPDTRPSPITEEGLEALDIIGSHAMAHAGSFCSMAEYDLAKIALETIRKALTAHTGESNED